MLQIECQLMNGSMNKMNTYKSSIGIRRATDDGFLSGCSLVGCLLSIYLAMSSTLSLAFESTSYSKIIHHNKRSSAIKESRMSNDSFPSTFLYSPANTHTYTHTHTNTNTLVKTRTRTRRGHGFFASSSSSPSTEFTSSDNVNYLTRSSSFTPPIIEDNPNTVTNSAAPSSPSDDEPKAAIGEWQEMHGNYVLPPPFTPDLQQPRALIHFLGGAIVGAAPDISYRYILEKLSQKGFLIVATPYTLSFDHIATCDDIIGRFERIAPTLAQQYGPVPVVGVGHSCGALLHLLITTLFPDTPRAANALISYNNKGVKEAVPLFDEVVAPLFLSLATKPMTKSSSSSSTTTTTTTNTNQNESEYVGNETKNKKKKKIQDDKTPLFPPSSLDLIDIGLQLARPAVQGKLPSDELLTQVLTRTLPPSLFSTILSTTTGGGTSNTTTNMNNNVQIPKSLRTSLEQILDPITQNQFTREEITPFLDQTLDILEQIPLLIEEVAEGAREFIPPPSSVAAAARQAYRARRTLLIQYDNDTAFDESEQIEALLREAKTVMRMKRPMVDFDIQRVILKGGHATPCFAPPLNVAERIEGVLGEDVAKDRLLYDGADATVDALVQWLEEGRL